MWMYITLFELRSRLYYYRISSHYTLFQNVSGDEQKGTGKYEIIVSKSFAIFVIFLRLLLYEILRNIRSICVVIQIFDGFFVVNSNR